MSSSMNIRLDPEFELRLDQLTEVTLRPKSFLATRVLRDFDEIDEWQIPGIGDLLKEMDDDDFASDQIVSMILDKWSVGAS